MGGPLRISLGRQVDTNLVFQKTIPNFVQYWADRKKDLLTGSANEVLWLGLSCNECI